MVSRPLSIFTKSNCEAIVIKRWELILRHLSRKKGILQYMLLGFSSDLHVPHIFFSSLSL